MSHVKRDPVRSSGIEFGRILKSLTAKNWLRCQFKLVVLVNDPTYSENICFRVCKKVFPPTVDIVVLDGLVEWIFVVPEAEELPLYGPTRRILPFLIRLAEFVDKTIEANCLILAMLGKDLCIVREHF